MTDIAASGPKYSFLEGSNLLAAAAIPVGAILCGVFYDKIAHYIAPLGIKIEDVYIYVFSLFAIEFGALLALFALLACKPTAFLERIKSTRAFAAILVATKITMIVVTLALAVTFVFGLLRLEPEHALALHSYLFIAWAALAALATAFYARTVLLIFTALA